MSKKNIKEMEKRDFRWSSFTGMRFPKSRRDFRKVSESIFKVE